MSSYTTLLSDIPDMLDNQSEELAAELDTLIDLAELMLSRDLDVGAFKHQAAGTIQVGTSLVGKPAGYLAPRYLRLTSSGQLSEYGSKRVLEHKTLDWLLEYWPDDAALDVPKYYAEFDDDRLIIAPSSSDTFAYEIGFRRRLPALSDSNTTNWLTENAYDALLTACLVNGAAYAKDPAQVEVWRGHYATLIEQINREHRRTLRDDRREITKDSENRGD
jgi:fermentation-respiration switch protein FrsA (DUF1100 family)